MSKVIQIVGLKAFVRGVKKQKKKQNSLFIKNCKNQDLELRKGLNN